MDDTQSVLIDTKDVFFYILRRIKVVIVLSLVLCMLGLSFAWFRKTTFVETYNMLDISSKIPGETDDNYNNRCNKVNQAIHVMETIDYLSTRAQIQNEYLSNSILMQLDPLNTAVSDAQLAIISDSEFSGVPDALCIAYEIEIRNGDFINDVANSLGCEPKYVSELITVNSSAINEGNGDDISSSTANASVVILNIEVVGESTEITDTILDSILTDIFTYNEEINSNVSIAHSIDLIGRQSSVSYSDSVSEAQLIASTYTHDIQQRINNQNNVLDSLAKQLGYSDRNGLYSPPTGNIIANSKKPFIEFGLVGFLSGAILAVIILFATYVWGKKVLTQKQFFLMFNDIDSIGICKPLSSKSVLSQYIDKKTGDDIGLTVDAIDRLISYNYRNLIVGMNKVLITSTLDSEYVKKKIKDLDIVGDVRLDMFSNPDILAQAASYDGIVMIEQRALSDKKKVEAQIKLLKNTGRKIIGAVLL